MYAAALGAFESKGIVLLMSDFGHAMKPVLAIDTMAAEHILHRQEMGRLKHVERWHICGNKTKSDTNMLRVSRVMSEENVADLGTKALRKAASSKHSIALVWRCSVTLVQVQIFEDGWQDRQLAEHIVTSSSVYHETCADITKAKDYYTTDVCIVVVSSSHLGERVRKKGLKVLCVKK